MQREELAAWLRLALTPGIGRGTARRLLAAFGLPQQLFSQPSEALCALVTPAQALALQAAPPGWSEVVEATWAWRAQDPGSRHVLSLADPAYPAALLQTEDPPLLLHVAGRAPIAWPRAISVVGSRNPTPQGQQNARMFARSFAQSGLAVVSGMALGIDAAAHEGALEGAAAGGLATIAVVGTGLDRVYPRAHQALARRIFDQGLLVSEYVIGTPPLAENFPQRNRNIAALGLGTVVVEAALASGSLITARQAAEQGKEVFAIPGSIHSPQSRGCHALIREGAKLVETAADVLEELAPGTPRAATSPTGPAPGLRATPVLDALGHEPTSLDALVARTGCAASELQAQLLELELSGHVARLPGGVYQRIAQG